MLYNIQIFKMAAIATTVLQETKPGDWAACMCNNQNNNFKTNVKRDKIVLKMLTDHCDVLV